MIGRQFYNRVAVTVAVTGMLLSLVPDITMAATTLKNGENVSGFIRTSSPSFTFKNQSLRGSPTQKAYGEEYTFDAQQNDSIIISVEAEDGSNLAPVLVLISSQTGAQVAYDDRSSLLRYRVPTTGQYKLRVLGKNNSLGRYRLSVAGITQNTASENPSTQPTSSQTSDRRREFLQNEYGLRVLESCPAQRNSVVVANFPEYGQTYTYCATPNRALKAGEYTYDVASNELKAAGSIAQTPSTQTTATDRRKEFLQSEYGLKVLDNCPAVKSSLVVAYFTEYGQTSTYCATPNRLIKAGEYTYDSSSNDLKPGSPITQNSLTQSTTADERKKLLQNDYGLTVLDSCPAERSSLVAVSFTEQSSGQIYTYCANPNRLFTAGEYAYNPTTRNLDPTKKPQRCTVEVGGICIVK